MRESTMTQPSDFAKSYLAMQGVAILTEPRVVSKPIGKREGEFVPKVDQYERGDG